MLSHEPGLRFTPAPAKLMAIDEFIELPNESFDKVSFKVPEPMNNEQHCYKLSLCSGKN